MSTASDPGVPAEPIPDLSVIVVTHRTRCDTRHCLTSLTEGGLEGVRSEVIVIDNGGDDGTAEMVRAEFPQFRLIVNDQNLGFSHGNNQGIEVSQGEAVLLLNPDTLVPPGALARCVAFLRVQPEDVAAMTCRVESPDGSVQWTCSRRLITPWSECARALLLDRLFKKSDFFNPEPITAWDRRDTRAVECLLGAFMLIRRSALRRLGPLDESFFLMYEDVDWCKRAADAGYRLMFWADEHIVHLGGQAWKQEPVIVFANAHLSALTYFQKHYPRSVRTVRWVSRVGMELKVLALRLNLLRKPGDPYTLGHLAMARAARATLKTGNPLPYGGWATTTLEAERS